MTAAETRTKGAGTTNGAPAELFDVIVMPSRTRPDGFHFIEVNVLAGFTVGCSCEAGRRGEICWARKEVDAVEGSWGFTRCIDCGALMRLGFWHGGSSPVRIWVCPRSTGHSSHESATAALYRVRADGEFGPADDKQQSHAVGSNGSWRVEE